MTTTTPLLHIDAVRAEYGDVTALHDVSFDIGDNEFFALLGPSGCGKTTLLRSIAGFETPTAGTIELEGRDLVPLPPEKRPVNMMFQSYALFPHMSVEKNIAYGLRAEGLDRTQVRARVAEALEVVSLAHLAHRRPAQLSGGQRQRVALARAIVKRPRLLLLDEPLSALDRKVRAEMQLELKRLQHEVGMTFVIVTHDQEEAMTLADRIAVLNGGRLEQLDTPAALYARPRTRFVAGFIGEANLLDAHVAQETVDIHGFGVLPLLASAPAGAATAVIRPEHLRLDATGGLTRPGVVSEVSFVGGTSTVVVELSDGGPVLRASVPGVATHERGDAVEVGIDPAHVAVVSDQPAAAPASEAVRG